MTGTHATTDKCGYDRSASVVTEDYRLTKERIAVLQAENEKLLAVVKIAQEMQNMNHWALPQDCKPSDIGSGNRLAEALARLEEGKR